MTSLAYPSPDLVDGATRLRPWTLDDLGCVAEASTDARIPEGTTVPSNYTPEAGREFIERQWSRLQTGWGLSLAMSSTTSNAAVGLIVLMVRPQAGVAGIGYWVVPSARQQGHAARAVRLLSDWALVNAEFARVEAWVEPSNGASQHTLLSAGFELEGTLRSFLSFNTRRADAMVFSRVNLERG